MSIEKTAHASGIKKKVLGIRWYRHVSLMIIPMLLLAGITVAIGVASATTPTPVSGTWGTQTSTSTTETNNGGIMTRTVVGQWWYHGDMEGYLDGTIVVISSTRTLEGTGHSILKFKGTVLGSEPGEITCVLSGKYYGIGTTQSGSSWEATCSNGIGGLENLNLHYQASNVPGSNPPSTRALTYSGIAHFDP
ncbi:MAG: hypothetical protein HYY22_06680 [Thaumarchaeota archaeon]|nr:hypothetical protein [Nitrososphaerota archaeon]